MRDLAWLVAVAEYSHVTDTAAILGVSQPTLSRALARVEEELDARLFERVPSGVLLTPDGELAVEAAREVGARYEQLLTELAARHDPEGGVVRLAFLDSMATSLVPALLREFHEEAPRVRVILRQEPAHEMTGDLQSGVAEVAITSPRPEGDYAWLPIQEERLVLIVPPTHRLRGRRRVVISDLVGEELVTTPLGFGYRRLVEALLAEAGVAVPVSFESGDLATIEGLVAAGLGVAIVPEQFAGVSGSIGITIGSRLARRTVGLAWRGDRPLPAPAQRLVDFVSSRSSGRPGR